MAVPLLDRPGWDGRPRWQAVGWVAGSLGLVVAANNLSHRGGDWVSPAPVPVNQGTRSVSAQTFRRLLTDGRMQRRAVTDDAKIRAEDGVGEAVRLILGIRGLGLQTRVT